MTNFNSLSEEEKLISKAYQRLYVQPQHLSLVCSDNKARKSAGKILLKKYITKNTKAELKLSPKLIYYSNSPLHHLRKLTFYPKESGPALPPDLYIGKRFLRNCNSIHTLDLSKLESLYLFSLKALSRLKKLKELSIILLHSFLEDSPCFFNKLSLSKLSLQIYHSYKRTFLVSSKNFQQLCNNLVQHKTLKRLELDFKSNLYMHDQAFILILFQALNKIQSQNLSFFIQIHVEGDINIIPKEYQNFLSQIEHFSIEQWGLIDFVKDKNSLVLKKHRDFQVNFSTILPYCTSLKSLSLIAWEIPGILKNAKLPKQLKNLQLAIEFGYSHEIFGSSKLFTNALSTVDSLESVTLSISGKWSVKLHEYLSNLHHVPCFRDVKNYSFRLFDCYTAANDNNIFKDLSEFIQNLKLLERVELILYQRVSDFDHPEFWNTLSSLKLKELCIKVNWELDDESYSQFFQKLGGLKTLEVLHITTLNFNKAKIQSYLPKLPELKDLKIEEYYSREGSSKQFIGLRQYLANK